MLIMLIVAMATPGAGLAVGHVRARRELSRTRAELADTRRLVERDPLTGLPNRVGAQRQHRRQTAAGRPAALVLLDLDDFTSVNDTWGHATGDALLAAVATRLLAACTPISAEASRLAGDEFLLLIPHPPTDPAGDGVLAHANAILAALSTPLDLHLDHGGADHGTGAGTAGTTTPRASAGIALSQAGNTWTDQLRRADIALYHAKAEPGRAMLHTHGMHHPSSARQKSGVPTRPR
jgi:diguanylate cyclase (GGDEF)-like protein